MNSGSLPACLLSSDGPQSSAVACFTLENLREQWAFHSLGSLAITHRSEQLVGLELLVWVFGSFHSLWASWDQGARSLYIQLLPQYLAWWKQWMNEWMRGSRTRGEQHRPRSQSIWILINLHPSLAIQTWASHLILPCLSFLLLTEDNRTYLMG